MSNKIIIDGVNVAECKDFEHYKSKDIKGLSGNLCKKFGGCPYCEGNPNCKYKQLQRLKAENKRLKEPSLIVPTYNQVAVSLEEYEKIKKEIQELKIAYKDNLKLCEWQEKHINKLATCIEEIREIASDAIDIIIENDELINYVGCIYNKTNEVLADE